LAEMLSTQDGANGVHGETAACLRYGTVRTPTVGCTHINPVHGSMTHTISIDRSNGIFGGYLLF